MYKSRQSGELMYRRADAGNGAKNGIIVAGSMQRRNGYSIHRGADSRISIPPLTLGGALFVLVLDAPLLRRSVHRWRSFALLGFIVA